MSPRPPTRQFGRGLLGCLEVIPKDIKEVGTNVGELIANVVRHAQPAGGRFQVLPEYHADRVVITAADAGDGFAFRECPPSAAPVPKGTGERRAAPIWRPDQ